MPRSETSEASAFSAAGQSLCTASKAPTRLGSARARPMVPFSSSTRPMSPGSLAKRAQNPAPTLPTPSYTRKLALSTHMASKHAASRTSTPQFTSVGPLIDKNATWSRLTLRTAASALCARATAPRTVDRMRMARAPLLPASTRVTSTSPPPFDRSQTSCSTARTSSHLDTLALAAAASSNTPNTTSPRCAAQKPSTLRAALESRSSTSHASTALHLFLPLCKPCASTRATTAGACCRSTAAAMRPCTAPAQRTWLPTAAAPLHAASSAPRLRRVLLAVSWPAAPPPPPPSSSCSLASSPSPRQRPC